MTTGVVLDSRKTTRTIQMGCHCRRTCQCKSANRMPIKDEERRLLFARAK